MMSWPATLCRPQTLFVVVNYGTGVWRLWVRRCPDGCTAYTLPVGGDRTRDTCQCQIYVTSSDIFGNNIKKGRYNVDSNELCNKIHVFFDVTLCREK